MNHFLRTLFFLLLVKPIIFFVLGLNVYHRERLPKRGPAIFIANHNSHLDTLILMSLFPLSQLSLLRPVAAADYFLRNRFLSWFSKKIMNIIPIQRSRVAGQDLLQDVSEALLQGQIIIFYPEGTRGEPEQLAKLKSGIAHLASRHPAVDIYPIFLYGAGKALPKGEALLVPFVVDIRVGEAVHWEGNKQKLMAKIEKLFTDFAAVKKKGEDLASLMLGSVLVTTIAGTENSVCY